MTYDIYSSGGGVWLSVTVVHVRLYSKKPELHWPALARWKTGFSGTDDAINRIIRLTIQTGFITAVFATLDVICFLALPHTTINFVWDFALSKLYTNALLSTLNARSSWGKLVDGDGNNPLFGREVSPTRSQLGTFTTPTFRAVNSATSYELHTTSALSDPRYRHGSVFGAVPSEKEINVIIEASTPIPTESISSETRLHEDLPP
ncbi:hypothetical protein H0H92_008730 [Tricholoma furcatifolium]|nr:hypothetical protein H0H92_008730 [Tricholoma furcatifolium]